jgi:hypothetical protein
VERHIERVRARVRKGGHDIPEADIRRRFDNSRLNLIHLMPRPKLVLHMERGRIVGPRNLVRTPEWAKPIVAAGMLHDR